LRSNTERAAVAYDITNIWVLIKIINYSQGPPTIGKGVDYKEVANNVNARILSIGFGKDNRVMEIIGTQMTSQ
jgi:hypothetical protein